MLTIKEIADRLNIPESNLRYYRDNYWPYLLSEGEGRKKRYAEECVEIFALISDLTKRGSKKREIQNMLSVKKEPQQQDIKLRSEEENQQSVSIAVTEQFAVINNMAKQQEESNLRMSEMQYAINELMSILEKQNMLLERLAAKKWWEFWK